MTEAERNVKLLTVVLCDDVRQENNGKFILIGVYGSSIIVREFPAKLMLCYWVLLETKEKGILTIRFKVHTPDTPEAVQGELKAEIVDPKVSATLPIGRLPITLKKPGDLVLEWQIDDGPWTTIGRHRVSLREELTAS